MSVSRIIDDYFFQAIARVNKHIIIFSKENRENDVTVYSDLIPTDFIIDKSFYYSNSFLGDLNQLKNLIERYLDIPAIPATPASPAIPAMTAIPAPLCHQ